MAEPRMESSIVANRQSLEPRNPTARSNSNATEISMAAALQNEPAPAAVPIPGNPSEQLQVENPAVGEEIQYPTGAQLWLNMTAVMLVCFLHGLDLTIVAVAVPSLTDQFKTVADIGWYSAVYGLVFSSTCLFFGKLYTIFDLKRIYMGSVALFELGSVVCTFAPSSKIFIMGRALAGLGAAGQGAGAKVLIMRFVPNHKRPVMNGILGFAQSFGLCSAPVIGGALTDAFTWRACFGINIPIGIVAIAITAIGMKDPSPNADINLPVLEKLKRIDILGTLLIVPSMICLLMGLQWGGNRYGWTDARIITLFVVFAFLCIGFGYVQHRQQEKAVVPPRILKNKTVLAAALFSCCLNGATAVTEFYIAVYFQGVRGYTATKAGLLGLPLIVGLAIAVIAAAFGTTWIGYYSPFMYAAAVLGPIAAGILTTIDLNDSQLKVAGLLGLLGFALGLGMQAPVTAVMTILSSRDAPIGLGVVSFGTGLGSSLCIATSAALFHDRLDVEISAHAPGTNISAIDNHGLGDLRNSIGPDRLKDLLFGYNEAVVQTLYVPLGLTLLAILGAIFTEVRSVKKKRE